MNTVHPDVTRSYSCDFLDRHWLTEIVIWYQQNVKRQSETLLSNHWYDVQRDVVTVLLMSRYMSEISLCQLIWQAVTWIFCALLYANKKRKDRQLIY